MPSEKIKAFLDADAAKIEDIIAQYPRQLPTSVVADLLGCSVATARTIIEQNPKLGCIERKAGKVNAGFVVPTAHFVRWYLLKEVI